MFFLNHPIEEELASRWVQIDHLLRATISIIIIGPYPQRDFQFYPIDKNYEHSGQLIAGKKIATINT